jgi:hypothetical protein
LVLVDVLAALIKYLPLTLHGNQVLLLGEAGTVDIGHPVPCTFSIYKVPQVSIFKDLDEMRHERFLLFSFLFLWNWGLNSRLVLARKVLLPFELCL